MKIPGAQSVGGGNNGLPNMTDIMKLRKWGTSLIKAGQKHRDPRMLMQGIKLHIHSQKLGVPHDGDNEDLGTQSQPQLGTQA